MFETMLEQAAQSSAADVRWMPVMEGVRVCGFDCGQVGEILPSAAGEQHETLFCQNGTLQVCMADGGSIWVRKREILLISDASQIQSIRVSGKRFQGMLVAVNAPAARGSLLQLCRLLGGLKLDVSQVAQLMRSQSGLVQVREQAWSEAVFSALEGMPTGEQGNYCVLKAVELLYLLCCGSLRISKVPSERYQDRYQRDTVRQVNDYIHAHLAENLSIEHLAQRFRISPTVLKTCFCQTYGKPLHRYISACRLERAAELLDTTALPVIQIASEVGYSSVSQFGAVFKRKYYLTPAQYRRREKKV